MFAARAALVLGMLAAVEARAEEVPLPEAPPTRPPLRPREIVVEIPGLRTERQRLGLGALGGVALVAGSVGFYFHLESRAAANAVSASRFTGEPWSAALAATVERGARDRRNAAIGYAIGGAAAIAAIAYYIHSSPPATRHVIRPHVAATSLELVGTWAW
jgi:hypothetical protein